MEIMNFETFEMSEARKITALVDKHYISILLDTKRGKIESFKKFKKRWNTTPFLTRIRISLALLIGTMRVWLTSGKVDDYSSFIDKELKQAEEKYRKIYDDICHDFVNESMGG